MTNLITSEKISVVIQGPVYREPRPLSLGGCVTSECLKSIRENLPNAEIIISTWKNSDIDGLDYDILIENNDPGAIKYSDGIDFYYNNINRQIVSTLQGLKKCTRTYAIKLRSDTMITGTGFANYYTQYPCRMNDFKYFKGRIIIPCISRSPLKGMAVIFFHPTDYFMFGLTEDLLDLWDIPLQSSTLITKWLNYQSQLSFINKVFLQIYKLRDPSNYYSRITAEQYIWISYLNKKGYLIDMNRNIDINFQQYIASEYSIINNFLMIRSDKLGIKPPERLHERNNFHVSYTDEEWLDQYVSLCLKKRKLKGLLKIRWYKRLILLFANTVLTILLGNEKKQNIKMFVMRLKRIMMSHGYIF